jgi:hypothetical protein
MLIIARALSSGCESEPRIELDCRSVGLAHFQIDGAAEVFHQIAKEPGSNAGAAKSGQRLQIEDLAFIRRNLSPGERAHHLFAAPDAEPPVVEEGLKTGPIGNCHWNRQVLREVLFQLVEEALLVGRIVDGQRVPQLLHHFTLFARKLDRNLHFHVDDDVAA